jgi:RNA 2',3'-cyclic 3'-phosphodiesterase
VTEPRGSAPRTERPLRLFVALDLPDAVRTVLAAAGAAADPATWRAVAPEALHVTLAFLGSRPPTDVAAIAPIVTAERVAPRLALGAVALLPPRRARVLTVTLVDPSGALAALQARVADALTRAGVYTPEEPVDEYRSDHSSTDSEARPFRPHVTLARLRPRTRAPRTIDLRVDPLEFSATAVTLYLSRLGSGGARYEAVAAGTLRG